MSTTPPRVPLTEHTDLLPDALFRWFYAQAVCDVCATPVLDDLPCCPWCAAVRPGPEWATPGMLCADRDHLVGSHAHDVECVDLVHRPRQTRDRAPVPMYVATSAPRAANYRVTCPRCGRLDTHVNANTDRVLAHGPARSCGGFVLAPGEHATTPPRVR